MNMIQRYVFNTYLTKEEAFNLTDASNKTFERAISGIKINVPEFIESMNQLSYKELRDVRHELFKERNYGSVPFKKEGLLELIDKEIDYTEYESSQCNVEEEDHLSIGDKSLDELKKLIPKIGGSISWRLYNKISNNEALLEGNAFSESDNEKNISDEDIAEKILDEMDINTGFPKELIADDLDPLFEIIGKLDDGEIKEVINIILQKSEQNGQIPLYNHCVSFLNDELRKRRDLLYLIKTKVRNDIETYNDLYKYLVDKDTSLPIFKLFINQHLKDQKIPCALLHRYHLAFHNQEPSEKPESHVIDGDGTLGQLYNKESEKDIYNQNLELIEKCKSEEYKEVFGNLYMRLPAGIHLTDKGKELAKLSDSQLKYIINKNKDDEDKVKYESFELQLREIFYEKYKGSTVHEIIERIVTNKHALNNFGRGSTLVWPLAVVYEVEKKIDQFMKKTKFNNEIQEDTHDSVEKPKHYMFNIDGYDVQAIDIVRGLLTPEEFRGWIKGSYFTYLMRADRKNGIEDLEKAKTFLNWQIQLDNEEELSIPGKNDEK